MKITLIQIKALCFSAVILCSCARSYRPVLVGNLNYESSANWENVEMRYKYDVLRQSGNKKYAKKEIAKNIRVIAVQFTNMSDRPVNFSEDVVIYSGSRIIIPLPPELAKKGLKQIAPLHLLWCLLWVNISTCDGYDCSSTLLPVGPAIGLFNMLKASGANKNLLAELTRYNMLNKTIDPGETLNGLITIAAESGQALQIRLKDSDFSGKQ
ncbi:MAG TPA: hypothetical protein VK589_22435 [Chryseolinea sp.]|nr:hypothetical protein [Chryseolinea sp.]